MFVAFFSNRINRYVLVPERFIARELLESTRACAIKGAHFVLAVPPSSQKTEHDTCACVRAFVRGVQGEPDRERIANDL